MIEFLNKYRKQNHIYGYAVSKKDVSNVNKWEISIRSILSLQAHNDLMPYLKEAFATWRKIPYERAKNEKTEIILSAYLQQGKIYDYMTKITTFIDKIESIEDADTISMMAYNNYFYFLQYYIYEMKEKIEHFSIDNVPAVQSNNAKTVAWFIQDECSTVSTIRNIPKAYEAVKRLKKGLNIERTMTSQQKEDIGIVSECMEMLSLRIPDEDILEMKRIEKSLRIRLDSMKKNAEKADIIYESLLVCFDNEWFYAINPESEKNMVKDLNKDELKVLYKKKMNDYFARIDKIKIEDIN